jgi:hypothetical protein
VEPLSTGKFRLPEDLVARGQVEPAARALRSLVLCVSSADSNTETKPTVVRMIRAQHVDVGSRPASGGIARNVDPGYVAHVQWFGVVATHPVDLMR